MWSLITDGATLTHPAQTGMWIGQGAADLSTPWRHTLLAQGKCFSMVASCLGGFALCVQGEQVDPSRWGVRNGGWRRVVGVMAYLIAHHRRRVTKEELIDTFWDEADGISANQSLDRTVSALRRALEPNLGRYQRSAYVLGPDNGYRFSPDVYVAVDAEEFVARFKEAAAMERRDGIAAAVPFYQQAEAMYAGPYMYGVPYAELWCHYQSQILSDYHRTALTRLAYFAWRSHDFDSLASYAHRVLGEYGCEGDVCRWLVDAYAKGAATTAARRHVETCPYRRKIGGAPCPDLSLVLRR